MTTTQPSAQAQGADTTASKSRWLALYVLCLGDLMIVLDQSIVNVALPSIRTDLGFSQASLAWVVNAYLLTFGGFLLLSGRLGDLFGAKKVFLSGVVAFVAASAVCGLAPSASFLVVGRAVQGLAGASVSAVALALIMGLFSEPGDRAKAMGVFGFVMSGGGAVGVLAGGVLTGLLNWHWIFLVNVPVGIAVVVAARAVLPADDVTPGSTKLDVPGAVLVTSGPHAGRLRRRRRQRGRLDVDPHRGPAGHQRGPVRRLRGPRDQGGGPAGPAAAVQAPQRLASRRWSASSGPPRCSPGSSWPRSTSSRCWATAPSRSAWRSCPTSLVMMFCSLKLSDRLVMAFGIRAPLTVGLALAAASLGLFAMAPVDGSFVTDVLPSMILLGIGAGIAFNPVLLAAMGDVEPHEAGLASGVVNTSFMMGGALGLAVLVAVSESRTASLAAGGSSAVEALHGGLQIAFAVGAVAAALAAVVGGVFLRPQAMSMPEMSDAVDEHDCDCAEPCAA